MFIVLVWWFVSAHKWFKGPTINVEHHMLGRHPIEGVEGGENSGSGSDVGTGASKKMEAGADVLPV
jgi:hypothetical protein